MGFSAEDRWCCQSVCFFVRHRMNSTFFLEEARYHRGRTRRFGAEQERNAIFGDCSAAAIVLYSQ